MNGVVVDALEVVFPVPGRGVTGLVWVVVFPHIPHDIKQFGSINDGFFSHSSFLAHNEHLSSLSMHSSVGPTVNLVDGCLVVLASVVFDAK